MFEAVLLDKTSLAADDLDLSAWFSLPLKITEYETTAAQNIMERIADAQIVLTNKVLIDATVMASAPQLKLIILFATGTNNVDLVAAKKHNIRVCNMIDYCTESVAQHVFAMMLTLATKLLQCRDAIKQGRWQQSQFFGLLDFPAIELRGKTLGLIGYGAIAKRVESMARCFGMQVLISQSVNLAQHEQIAIAPNTMHEQRVPLQQLLTQVDFLSIHCPLTPQTKNLISSAEIALMRRSAFIINTARGGIVDESALAYALRHGTLAGAAFDVLSQEPPPDEHVLLAADIPNLILTPHSAWSSQTARQTLINQTYAILRQWCEQGDVSMQRVV